MKTGGDMVGGEREGCMDPGGEDVCGVIVGVGAGGETGGDTVGAGGVELFCASDVELG